MAFPATFIPTLQFAELELRGFPAMRKRDFNNARKAAWKVVGEHWAKHMLPKHFTEKGAAEYRYEPLSRKYSRRKRRKLHGRTTPLVFTGTLRRHALSPQNVVPSFKGVTVKIMHPVRARKVHDQLTRVSPAERKGLAGVFHDDLARRLRSFKGRRRVRLRRAA